MVQIINLTWLDTNQQVHKIPYKVFPFCNIIILYIMRFYYIYLFTFKLICFDQNKKASLNLQNFQQVLYMSIINLEIQHFEWGAQARGLFF